MAKPVKYKFIKQRRGFMKPTTYYKEEHELEDHEVELLYGEFEQHWNRLPMKLKNRFLKWLIEEGNKLKKN